MKKLTALLLALVMALSLTACSFVMLPEEQDPLADPDVVDPASDRLHDSHGVQSRDHGELGPSGVIGPAPGLQVRIVDTDALHPDAHLLLSADGGREGERLQNRRSTKSHTTDCQHQCSTPPRFCKSGPASAILLPSLYFFGSVGSMHWAAKK